MNKPELDDLAWRTSSYTSGQGNCVEIALAPAGVLVRDTKDRPGGTLSVPPVAWDSFLRGLL